MPRPRRSGADIAYLIWQDWTSYGFEHRVEVSEPGQDIEVVRIDSRGPEELQEALEKRELLFQEGLEQLDVGDGFCLVSLFFLTDGPDPQLAREIVSEQMKKARISSWKLAIHYLSQQKEES